MPGKAVKRIRLSLARVLKGSDSKKSFRIEHFYFKLSRFLAMRGISNPLSPDPQGYWESRDIGEKHGPDAYLGEDNTTYLLFDDLLNVLDTKTSFLDIGCNAGRNLNYLFKKGFRDLAGIDINPVSINEVMKKEFPDLFNMGTFYVGNAAHVIKNITDERYDVVFSNGVLEHISPENMGLFKDMVRVCRRYIVVITSENSRVHPYDFEKVFTRLGCKMILYRLFYGIDNDFCFPRELYNERKHFFNSTFLRIFVKVYE